MEDARKLALLRQYEPVLRYVKNERFFPATVETFLAYSKLYKTGTPTTSDAPSPQALAQLSPHHYLRFSPTTRTKEILLGWLILFVIGLAVGLFLGALKLAFWLGIGLLIVLYLSMSHVRVRLVSATLAAGALVYLVYLPGPILFSASGCLYGSRSLVAQFIWRWPSSFWPGSAIT